MKINKTMTKLSKKALNELKKVLKKDLGNYSELTDEIINDIGITLLELTAICLKREIKKSS